MKQTNKKFQLGWMAILFALFIVQASAFAQSNQSSDDVLKSISDNVGDSVDPGKLLMVIFSGAGLIVLIALLSRRETKAITPKTLNHPGKLIKEISKSVNLKPAEVKQLKVLADQTEVSNPLVLLLCPSLLTQAVKDNPGKINRQTILSVARKISAK
ncbi:MAG TPA: hypothetical protein VGF52_01145 [Tepidisphaeraceae bacterium]|jgi:hypothetical protein